MEQLVGLGLDLAVTHLLPVEAQSCCSGWVGMGEYQCRQEGHRWVGTEEHLLYELLAFAALTGREKWKGHTTKTRAIHSRRRHTAWREGRTARWHHWRKSLTRGERWSSCSSMSLQNGAICDERKPLTSTKSRRRHRLLSISHGRSSKAWRRCS